MPGTGAGKRREHVSKPARWPCSTPASSSPKGCVSQCSAVEVHPDLHIGRSAGGPSRRLARARMQKVQLQEVGLLEDVLRVFQLR